MTRMIWPSPRPEDGCIRMVIPLDGERTDIEISPRKAVELARELLTAEEEVRAFQRFKARTAAQAALPARSHDAIK